jgi:hypothetical protein
MLQENGDALLTEESSSLLLEGEDMALQYTPTVVNEAAALENICSQLSTLTATVEQFVKHNTHLAIDWGAGSTPAYINEEANGNLLGKGFTRQQVANAIGSLTQLRNLMNNQAVTEGDHLGNLNQLARPLG